MVLVAFNRTCGCFLPMRPAWLCGRTAGPLFGSSQVIGADGVFICTQLSAWGQQQVFACQLPRHCSKITQEDRDEVLYKDLTKSHGINTYCN